MSGPYARVYFSIRTDPKFESDDTSVGVYDDDTLLASWVRLLIAAEIAWPAPADLPVWCKAASVKVLAEKEIIDLLPGHRYRVRGLDAERARRSQRASDAASVRWENTKNATASNVIPLDNGTDPVSAYWNLSGSYPSKKAIDWIDDLTGQYGAQAVISALAEAAKLEPRKIISTAQDFLRDNARQLAQAEKAQEQAKVAQRRVDGMMARRLDWFRNTGKWHDEWGERPAA